MTVTKNTFKAEEKIKLLQERSKKSLSLALNDAKLDLVKRINSGQGYNGKSYRYSDFYKKLSGKSDPVDWNRTGLLLRSMDFLVKVTQNKVSGLIGFKDVTRGDTSNKEILRKLVKLHRTLWGLSKTEKEKFINNFFRYFRR